MFGMSRDKESIMDQSDITPSRLVSFSDGVFAIAITLIVFSLKVPEVPPSGLSKAIAAMMPEFITYFFSFFVIGLFWMMHHRLFHYIIKVKARLLWLNILFLMLIAFIPFPSAMLIRYGTSFALIFYVGTLVVISLLGALIWEYVVAHKGLLDAHLPKEVIHYNRIRTIFFIVIFILITLISKYSPEGSKFLLLGIFPFRWLLNRWLNRRKAVQPVQPAQKA